MRPRYLKIFRLAFRIDDSFKLMSHAANDVSYLNLIIFGLDYSNLLRADTSMRLKQKRRLPYRKVDLKYFSDTWLLIRSPA